MDDGLDKVEAIIRDLFDEYEGPVTRALTAKQIPQWDSLGHVQFMVSVEQAFGVRFSTSELRKYANIGELLDAVALKQK